MKKDLLFLGILLLGCVGVIQKASAQKKENLPERYITDYDTSFTGIGPKVYHLPTPKTKEELIIEAYSQKTDLSSLITEKLKYKSLFSNLCYISGSAELKHILPENKDDFTQWNEKVNNPNIQESNYLYVPLLIELAKAYVKADSLDKATETFHMILARDPDLLPADQKTCIELNVLDIYLYENNLAKAESFLKSMQESSSRIRTQEQNAEIWVREARLWAAKHDFTKAENLIIRRAIPSFNRARAVEKKVWAWIELAKIYQLDNKYTEAQWFLLQARNVSYSHSFNEKLATIEYLLALSKYHQKNYDVAINEFILAEELAKKEDDGIMLLAISDKLGEIFLKQKKYKEAESYLKNYDYFRKQIF